MHNSLSYPIAPVKTREALASEYQIDVRTLRRWLKREKLSPPSGALNPKWQYLIYNAFGCPPQAKPSA